MNDQLQKSAADLLDAARAAGQNAATFLETQAPDVCKQLVKYQLINDLISTIIFFAICISILIGWSKLFRWAKKEDRLCDVSFGAPTCLLALIFIICFPATCNYLISCLQCIYAPKAVLFHLIFDH